MRTQAIVLSALVGLAGGCGHGSMSDRISDASHATARTFADAYDSVRTGAQKTARFGEYVVDKTGEGAVRVYRSARGGAQAAGAGAGDAYLTAKVKTKLAADPGVHSRDIDVDTDAGAVTLRGTVSGRAEAARAVEDAMNTDGVFAVESELAFPNASTGSRDVQTPADIPAGEGGTGLPQPEQRMPEGGGMNDSGPAMQNGNNGAQP